jgi:hypothetical protein
MGGFFFLFQPRYVLVLVFALSGKTYESQINFTGLNTNNFRSTGTTSRDFPSKETQENNFKPPPILHNLMIETNQHLSFALGKMLENKSSMVPFSVDSFPQKSAKIFFMCLMVPRL